MLKNRIIFKRIRNIIVLLMVLVIMLGAYRNIRISRAENVIEIRMNVYDGDNVLAKQYMDLEAVEIEKGTYTLKLPEAVHGNKVSKYYTCDGAEITHGEEDNVRKIQLTQEEIAKKEVELWINYDKKIVKHNNETKVLYNRELTYYDKISVSGYMPLNAELDIKDFNIRTLTDVKIPNKTQKIQAAYDLSIFEIVETKEILGVENQKKAAEAPISTGVSEVLNEKELEQSEIQTEVTEKEEQKETQTQVTEKEEQKETQTQVTEKEEQKETQTEVTEKEEQKETQTQVTEKEEQKETQTEVTEKEEQEETQTEVTEKEEREETQTEVTEKEEQEEIQTEVTEKEEQEEIQTEIIEKEEQEEIEDEGKVEYIAKEYNEKLTVKIRHNPEIENISIYNFISNSELKEIKTTEESDDILKFETDTLERYLIGAETRTSFFGINQNSVNGISSGDSSMLADDTSMLAEDTTVPTWGSVTSSGVSNGTLTLKITGTDETALDTTRSSLKIAAWRR